MKKELLFCVMVLSFCTMEAMKKRKPVVRELSGNEKSIDDLFRAISENDVNTVRNLLQNKKVNPNIQTGTYGLAPLHKAIQGGLNEIATLLLQNGADPNIQGGVKKLTPLHLAVSNNDLTLVDLLMQKGANPYIKNTDGYTVMDFAKMYSYFTILDLIDTYLSQWMTIRDGSHI